jgi:hypothetical protein
MSDKKLAVDLALLSRWTFFTEKSTGESEVVRPGGAPMLLFLSSIKYKYVYDKPWFT